MTPTLASTIAKLDELAAKATPGEWVYAAYDKRLVSDATCQTVGCTQADIEFIAALRNAWPEIRKALDEKGAEHATD